MIQIFRSRIAKQIAVIVFAALMVIFLLTSVDLSAFFGSGSVGTINGRKVDIPSYPVRAGDTVAVRASSGQNPTILHAMEEVKGRGIPEWLVFDTDKKAGTISSLPTREQINLPVQEQLIVELYSK